MGATKLIEETTFVDREDYKEIVEKWLADGDIYHACYDSALPRRGQLFPGENPIVSKFRVIEMAAKGFSPAQSFVFVTYSNRPIVPRDSPAGGGAVPFDTIEVAINEYSETRKYSSSGRAIGVDFEGTTGLTHSKLLSVSHRVQAPIFFAKSKRWDTAIDKNNSDAFLGAPPFCVLYHGYVGTWERGNPTVYNVTHRWEYRIFRTIPGAVLEPGALGYGPWDAITEKVDKTQATPVVTRNVQPIYAAVSYATIWT